MGHTRLGELERTRRWLEVMGLIAMGAGAAQVANAVLHAAERGMNLASDHQPLVESFWLLTQLPFAAREENFAAALRDRGLAVPDDPGLMEVVGAISEAVDARVTNSRARTDLGEMAQAAACESIVQLVTEQTGSMFATTSADVKAALAKLATVKQFGAFAREYYARLTDKVLQYYVSRATPNEIGPNQRFTTLAAKAAFDQALTLHCQEASRIVEKFAGEWFSLTNWREKGIDRERAQGFTHVALRKMVDELKAGAR